MDSEQLREFAPFHSTLSWCSLPVLPKELFDLLNCQQGPQPGIFVRVANEESDIGIICLVAGPGMDHTT